MHSFRTEPRVDSSPPLRLVALHRLLGHTSQVDSLLTHRFLPLLITGGDYNDHTVRVWDLDSRSLLHTLAGHGSFVRGLALDPAGRRIASGSYDGTVKLWDLESGACLRTIGGREDGSVFAVAWEATGSLVASGSWDKTVQLWHADSGALRHTLEGHSNWVDALAAHPADDLLASGSRDKTVRVWRWSSGAHVRTLAGHTGCVFSLEASAAWLVSGSNDKTVRVWSWASGACARVLDGFGSSVVALQDSTLATLEVPMDADKPEVVRFWDVSAADPSVWSCKDSVALVEWSVCDVAIEGRGRIVWAPDDRTTIEVWEV